jgi:ABC-type antimicrobial peptide transport system permease subunit
MRQGLGIVTTGLGAGLLATLVATRVLRAQLYGVTPTDPVTLAAVVALLAGVAAAATALPARRAARTHPMEALRHE